MHFENKDNFVSVVAAVNNDIVFKNNLQLSKLFEKKRNDIIILRDFISASKAYNHGLNLAKSNIVIFSHQDVYFPLFWEKLLDDAINKLNEIDNKWAVLGVFGLDKSKHYRGKVWSSGIGTELGNDLITPVEATSIDEMVIVLRKDSGILFDELLPGYHLYATDLIMEAKKQGYSSYIINAPAIHNSVPVFRLDQGYTNAYNYMKKKWKTNLPLSTCTVNVTKYGWPLKKWQIRSLISGKAFKMRPKQSDLDPKHISKKLGYE